MGWGDGPREGATAHGVPVGPTEAGLIVNVGVGHRVVYCYAVLRNYVKLIYTLEIPRDFNRKQALIAQR